jgi:hypothetical protein
MIVADPGTRKVRRTVKGAAMETIGNTIGRGMVTSFVATLVLSVMLDPIAVVTKALWPASPANGWLLHFVVGMMIWGAGFAFFFDHFRGPPWLRGLAYALLAWLLVMVVVTPLTGDGLFSLRLGILAPVITLIVHALYGAVLGTMHALLWMPGGEVGHHDDPHGDEHLHPLAR